MQNFRPHARLPLCFFGGSQERRRERDSGSSPVRVAVAHFRGAFVALFGRVAGPARPGAAIDAGGGARGAR